MQRLIYVSRAVDPSRDVLRDVLAQSRARNAEAGISGLLLYSGTSFLQLLEGEPAVVHETMARIGRDPRHRDVRVLVDEPAEARWFDGWTMGFQYLGNDPDGAPDGDLPSDLAVPMPSLDTVAEAEAARAVVAAYAAEVGAAGR